MNRFVFLTFNGLSHGAVYAAVALALVLIWRTTRVLNFAQGAMAIGDGVHRHLGHAATDSYWLGFAAALVGRPGARRARAAHRIPPAEHVPPLNTIVVGVGLLMLIEAVVGMIYGNGNRDFPAAFSRRRSLSATRAVLPDDLFIFTRSVLVLARWPHCSPGRRPGCACVLRRSRPRSPACSACAWAGC